MKTEMRLETHELTVIRIRRSQAVSAFCQKCNAEVLHLTVARAAVVLRISETAVFHLAEGDSVHSLENEAGALLICGNSVSALTKRNFTEGENYVD